MRDPDWPSGTPEWDERDDLYEVHDVSCDMGEDCTCGASELVDDEETAAFIETMLEYMMVAISEPAVPSATVITFWQIPPMSATFAHDEFGPFEI